MTRDTAPPVPPISLDQNDRQRIYDGTPFERSASYARAIRHGSYIAVSGTIAMDTNGNVAYLGDVYLQTRTAFLKAIAAVDELGGSLHDVVRTRIFLTPSCSWEGAAAAHAEIFRGVDPANTSLYVSGLFVPNALVEVEVDAMVTSLCRADSALPG